MYRQVIAIAAMLLAVSCAKEESKPQSETQKQQSTAPKVAPFFDGTKAFDYLTAQTNFGPRAVGTAAHQKCLNFLQTEMQKYAGAVNLQTFTHNGYNGEAVDLTNIISSFNLKATTRILLIAHWDSRSRAEKDQNPKKMDQPILGANDGASGVAILMEIARHLKATPPAVGIDMLFADGEDYGKEDDLESYLLGSKYFAKNLPQGFNPVYGILLDMVGDRQLGIPKESYSLHYAPDIVDLVWSTAKELGVYQFSDDQQGYIIDDHLPFNEIGIKTIDLIDYDYPDTSNRYWHTTEDTPDKCSSESLEAVGRVLMTVIYRQLEK